MKKYSYLVEKHGLDTFYRQVKTIDTLNYLTGRGQIWTVYGCIKYDCFDIEKYVAIRNYTKDRLTADTLEQLTKKVFDFEGRIG